MTSKATKRGERWKEASPANPCKVCGAKKWCRESPDGRVANCRNTSTGSVKTGTYRDGGQYYVHRLIDDGPKPNGKPKRTTRRPASEAPTADGRTEAVDVLTDDVADLRDKAYRLLLSKLDLSQEHHSQLTRRGLPPEAIASNQYRTLPADTRDIAHELLIAGGKHFKEIPGFIAENGAHIAGPGGLLIPVRDVRGRIIALVVRLDNAPEGMGKYRYISSRSPRNPCSPSPGSPAHVPHETRGLVDVVRATEGVLKADIASRLSGIPTIAFPGVGSWRRILPVLQKLQAKTVRTAFDADALTNPKVARPLLDCVKELPTHGYAVELERWPADAGKGIDDVYAAGRAADIEILTGPAALQAAEEIAAAAGADKQPAAPAAGGDSDAKKSQSTLLVELAQRAELWHTPGDGDAYASVRLAPIDCGEDDDTADDESDAGDKPGDGGPVAHWPVRTKAFRRWLARAFFLKHGKAPGSQALADATNVIEGQAVFSGQERTVSVRVAGHGGRLYLDLANADWQAVEIDADGWRVIESEACQVRFRRSKAMLPLPTPVASGDIGELRRFVNVDEDGWPLLLGWLAAALNPTGPYPILALHGEQGSAKTCTGLAVQKIVDPNSGGLRSEPREPRDLMIAATNCWVVAYDNLSHIEPWLSDALCRLSTGGGFATRTLFSDDEETIFFAKRPIILTGIEEVATRSDLLDRCVIVQLPRIPDDRRITEADFLRAFDAAAPRILGAVLDAVSTAVRNLPTTHIERLPRMADFALWATAAETGLGLRPGEFMFAYAENRQVANETALESSPVAKHILQLAHAGGWAGTPSDLHEKIETLATDQEKHTKSWPKTAKPLSGILKRLAPNFRAAGVKVEFGREGTGSDRKRRIEILSVESGAQEQGWGAAGAQAGAQESPKNAAGAQGAQEPLSLLNGCERCKVTI
jgi:hypothetical protein